MIERFDIQSYLSLSQDRQIVWGVSDDNYWFQLSIPIIQIFWKIPESIFKTSGSQLVIIQKLPSQAIERLFGFVPAINKKNRQQPYVDTFKVISKESHGIAKTFV